MACQAVMASWVPLEVQCKAGISSAGGQQLCDPGTVGGKHGHHTHLPETWEVLVVDSVIAEHKMRGKWLIHWEGFERSTSHVQSNPYKGQIRLILSSHLFSSGEWFVTISLFTSNSKQREIIFYVQRKGSTFVRGLILSALAYSKFFP